MIEVLECGSDLRFVKDEENPSKVGMIINEGYKPPFCGRGSNLGAPPNLWIRVKGWVGLYGCEGKEAVSRVVKSQLSRVVES